MFAHTNKGKKLFSELQNIFNEKDKYVIMRLASAYNTEDNAHTKVTILKTVCHEYSFHQLQDFGFHCTQGNYNYSKQSSSSTSLEISRAQKPKMPPSKRKLSNEEEKRFSEFIFANSTESSETSRRILSTKPKEIIENLIRYTRHFKDTY
ncbi:uncharacterized protein MONOS_12588 [Monocercomonoides exilis]|uniref:uncharacterized protein n=1 Tax=Monocercomonoides exilis TaxID=2049356 RepID=UPI00355A005B|nr:hypothetical protein MONOS_12588 [Monocercomonoides exilis]|eukprot:MONOS_12588.1-p1 / transcript=MONOS_12588.1 / gene=MONOS_12588 / organism=Monocercomonoides_exilis_PA203 / gene_product=unspecified product / transcript_product=unspecified product / location=Mono_scaffold00706:8670-9459(+) / protein_length=150 / sequence_SO=supercontig / SO=protein_coding / is_pseudo=false